MNFNSFRKEIISNNASVKELVNDIFAKIDRKDPEINSYIQDNYEILYIDVKRYEINMDLMEEYGIEPG